MENNTMTFHTVEQSNLLFQKLYEQKKSSRFCDITLYVNNTIVKAHRNVLACSSPYFDSILKHHRIVREQLTISCMDSQVFNEIVNFMYTGEITIQHSNVEELLKLADHFILTKVIEYCIEFLGTKLNLSNCLFTYFLTQRFKLKHLGNIVENWISSHIDEICKGEEIVNLNCCELSEFFKNKCFVLTTNLALDVLSRWVLTNLDKREKDFDKLLKCFPTNNLEPVEVFKHLDMSILYVKSELCLYRFLDYLLRNSWLLSNFKTRYDVLQAKYGQVTSESEKDADFDGNKHEDNKIVVSEKTDSSSGQNNFNSIVIKAKLRDRKRLILKKLMLLGLKPGLRMAALKMLVCKKKRILLDSDKDEGEDDPDEKVGIKCPICFTTINDSMLLEQHLALSHAKDVTYKCGICSFVCQYHGDYLNHMKSHFNGPPFKCDYCEYTVDQISKLISHRAQHLDESIYQCTFCSFKCRLKQNYVSHMKLHAPEKTFKCEQCSKTFRFKQNLESHMLTHTGEKNLSCDSCGFHTKFLSHMIAHKRIHTGSTNLTAINSNYHHFGDPADFHHHHHNHAHNIHNQILATTAAGAAHSQRSGNSQHHNNVVNHHMLTARTNPSTATSTAAAVAAAMMLDPRFHHNSTVPYHPTTTPVSMALQSSQQIPSSGQSTGEYPPTLQNCMTLF